MPLRSTNPATGEQLRSMETLDEEGLRAKLAQAAQAAAQQRLSTLDHRMLCLRKLAALVVEDNEELAHVITAETGKPVRAAREEVASCAEVCRYFTEHAASMMASEVLSDSPGQAYVRWDPIGVVLAVLPWESPLEHVFRCAVPALVAGNAVAVKHAGSVAQCALLAESLMRRSGFSRGTFTVLMMEDHFLEAAVRDDTIAEITVHGSETVCRALAAQAGWLLKPITLHLNGSDSLLIMPSADLDGAVAAAVRTVAGRTGKRIITHASVYEAVALHLVQALEALRVGDPMKEDTDVGPLGTPQALTALEEFVDAAVKAGGRVLSGGTRLIGRGNFFEPTLLSDVPHSSAVARETLSGPVALLFRVDSVQEAIELTNNAPFGSAVSVWTQEPSEQQVLLDGITAGTIAVNALPIEHPAYTSGGSKRSGHGYPSHHDWMHPKTVQLG